MWTDSNGRRWYKGNLHLHTTVSDGQKTPEESFELYLAHGYDFVARTDHWKVSEWGEYKGMLLVQGCEYDTGSVMEDGMYHILAIGCGPIAVEKKPEPPVQEIIDLIHKAGGLAGLAHPAWSLNTPEQILRLRDVDFTEIYNSTSGLPRNCRPDSGLLLDMAAVAGRMLPLAATDDVHWYIPEDTCRSFIMLQADELTKESVMEGLRARRYFASQGPMIDVRIEENKLIVDSTPVRTMIFYTNKPWERFRSISGEGLTHGEFRLSNQMFVRAEVIDEEGRMAWSQYFDLRRNAD